VSPFSHVALATLEEDLHRFSTVNAWEALDELSHRIRELHGSEALRSGPRPADTDVDLFAVLAEHLDPDADLLLEEFTHRYILEVVLWHKLRERQ
jgi:hypothetical protein